MVTVWQALQCGKVQGWHDWSGAITKPLASLQVRQMPDAEHKVQFDHVEQMERQVEFIR